MKPWMPAETELTNLKNYNFLFITFYVINIFNLLTSESFRGNVCSESTLSYTFIRIRIRTKCVTFWTVKIKIFQWVSYFTLQFQVTRLVFYAYFNSYFGKYSLFSSENYFFRDKVWFLRKLLFSERYNHLKLLCHVICCVYTWNWS